MQILRTTLHIRIYIQNFNYYIIGNILENQHWTSKTGQCKRKYSKRMKIVRYNIAFWESLIAFLYFATFFFWIQLAGSDQVSEIKHQRKSYVGTRSKSQHDFSLILKITETFELRILKEKCYINTKNEIHWSWYRQTIEFYQITPF